MARIDPFLSPVFGLRVAEHAVAELEALVDAGNDYDELEEIFVETEKTIDNIFRNVLGDREACEQSPAFGTLYLELEDLRTRALRPRKAPMGNPRPQPEKTL